MNFGIWELAIILVIVALLFGTAKLRNIGGDLGSALRSFRTALKDDGDEDDDKKTDHEQSGSDNGKPQA